MKKFIHNLFYFSIIMLIIGEFIIRLMYLVPNIPIRYIDDYGIQRYKQGQSGYYTGGKIRWNVNKDGWLGISDTEKDTIISIIGDSYIENMMNPIECNQGYLLKEKLPKYSFYEAGRSGVTFIEAMEISKILIKEIDPEYQLIYISESDLYESIAEISRYDDRVQISLNENKILKAKIKSTNVKKILYNVKLLYYLYLKYPVLVQKQDKNQVIIENEKNDKFDLIKFDKMFRFCKNNYNLIKVILVFHPDTDNRFISLAKKYGFKSILLDSRNDNPWELNNNDNHWSCYGHEQISKQVAINLSTLIKNIEE